MVTTKVYKVESSRHFHFLQQQFKKDVRSGSVCSHVLAEWLKTFLLVEQSNAKSLNPRFSNAGMHLKSLVHLNPCWEDILLSSLEAFLPIHLLAVMVQFLYFVEQSHFVRAKWYSKKFKYFRIGFQSERAQTNVWEKEQKQRPCIIQIIALACLMKGLFQSKIDFVECITLSNMHGKWRSLLIRPSKFAWNHFVKFSYMELDWKFVESSLILNDFG